MAQYHTREQIAYQWLPWHASPELFPIVQTLPRLYLEPADDTHWRPGVPCVLSPGQARYLGTVLRQSEGAALHLFNARDGEWRCEIVSLRKDRCVVHVGSQTRTARPPSGPTLAFAPLKRDATDLVVRMATELGVRRLVPIFTERSNTQRINAERWRAITIEAAEQCERLDLPEIAEPAALGAWVAGWPQDMPLYAALERDRRDAAPMPGSLAFGLMIGPEGGFSRSEAEWLMSHPFVRVLGLGPRILRADTAAASALAVLQAASWAGTEEL